jgi:hypothetical protein
MTATRLTDPAMLAGFTGSENLHKHRLSGLHYTDGVRFVLERGGTDGAFWVMDLIGSHQVTPRVRKEPFQVWEFSVDAKTKTCKVVCTDGNTGTRPLATQKVEFTDLAISLKFYVEDRVVMLPSER